MTEPRYGPSVRVGADAGPRFKESEDARKRRAQRTQAIQAHKEFWTEYYRRAKLREEQRAKVRRLAGWTNIPQFSRRYSEFLDNLNANKPNKKGR